MNILLPKMLCGLSISQNSCTVLNIDVGQDTHSLAFGFLNQLVLTYLLV